MDTNTTSQVRRCLAGLAAGDAAARDELLTAASRRLRALAVQMLRGFPGVARWEEADDVHQNASLRLCKALEEVQLQSPQHFFRLAALQIRRELIDLARKHEGPHGIGKNHQSHPGAGQATRGGDSTVTFDPTDDTFDPPRLAQWSEFHEKIGQLEEAQRELFDLIWYHELPHREVAELLSVDERTVRRRWQQARLALYQALAGESPAP